MIIIDEEMSGLDPRTHSILSLGAVDFSNPKRQFYREARLRRGATADPEAMKVNGFTLKQIKDKGKQTEKEMILKLCRWMDETNDRTLAGHNVQNDIKFLKHAIALYKIDYKINSRAVDTFALVYESCLKRKVRMPMKDNMADLKSDVVFRYCGLKEEPQPHNALTGARMEAESFSRLIYGKNLLKEFNKFKIPEYLAPGNF